MFVALTREHQVETQVFRDVEQADDWLELGIGMEELLDRTPD